MTAGEGLLCSPICARCSMTASRPNRPAVHARAGPRSRGPPCAANASLCPSSTPIAAREPADGGLALGLPTGAAKSTAAGGARALQLLRLIPL